MSEHLRLELQATLRLAQSLGSRLPFPVWMARPRLLAFPEALTKRMMIHFETGFSSALDARLWAAAMMTMCGGRGASLASHGPGMRLWRWASGRQPFAS